MLFACVLVGTALSLRGCLKAAISLNSSPRHRLVHPSGPTLSSDAVCPAPSLGPQ